MPLTYKPHWHLQMADTAGIWADVVSSGAKDKSLDDDQAGGRSGKVQIRDMNAVTAWAVA